MANSWRQAYEEMGDFIAKSPEIKISMTSIAIPGDVRPEFYRLFDMVRLAFMEQNFLDLLNKSDHLSESYTKAEEEVVKLLGLDEISMQAGLHRFLHDPNNQLARGLFDLLFDLLKGKIDMEIFEKEASGNIDVPFKDLYRLGYQKWVLLSLVKMLEADKIFDVSTPFLEEDRSEEPVGPITKEDSKLELRESKRLSFKHELLSTFIVPDLIVHSALINRYVAVRAENGTAVWTASEVNEKREWYPLDPIKKYGSEYLAKYGPVHLRPSLSIYVDDRAEDITLIADSERVCRPDLIVECMEQKDWYQKEGLETVKLHHDLLKPKLGTFIASMEPVPEHLPEKLAGECRLLVVGLDQSKLDSIIGVLKPQTEEQ